MIELYLLVLVLLISGIGESSLAEFHFPNINTLNDVISSSYLLDHDFLKCFSNGDFKNMEEAAYIFAKNHFKYSKNFANYLQTVASKIEQQFSDIIISEMAEELGNYKQTDIDKLTKIGIEPQSYDKIPHKCLTERFVDSLNKDNLANIKIAIDNQNPGDLFYEYMNKIYDGDNACESLAVIAFDEIGEIMSKLYDYIWKGLKHHTTLTDDEIVIFPLHAIIEDNKSASMKVSFEKYAEKHPSSCYNVEEVITNVLNERILLYDNIRKEIEIKQNYQCKLPYSSLNEQTNDNVGWCNNEKMIVILVHMVGYLVVLLKK